MGETGDEGESPTERRNIMAKFLNQMSMEPDAGSVSQDNPGKPSMEQMPESSTSKSKAKTKAKAKTMADDAQPDKSGKGPMGKFNPGKKEKPPKAYGEQEPAKKRAARAGESYLRLRVRVESGTISVVDARQVEGPLTQPSTIHGNYVAELLHNDEPVAVEAIPDLGERRPYFDPARALVEGGPHGSWEIPTAEFALRIPSDAISSKSLAKADIALYQVKDSSRPLRTRPDASLQEDYHSEVRQVARLNGVDLSNLTKAAQAAVKRVLK
jgi:hypothetical protein